MFRNLSILALAAGCHDVYLAPTASDAAPRASSSVCETWGGTYSTVVFTDEEAQNTVDFADNGSQAELEGKGKDAEIAVETLFQVKVTAPAMMSCQARRRSLLPGTAATTV